MSQTLIPLHIQTLHSASANMYALILLASCIGLAYSKATNAACAAIEPAIVNAVGQFCQNDKIYIPSAYALNGMRGWDDDFKKDKKAHSAKVWISGRCSPAQYVPQDICFQQFWDMCTSTVFPADGYPVNKEYGNDGCQDWNIQLGDYGGDIGDQTTSIASWL